MRFWIIFLFLILFFPWDISSVSSYLHQTCLEKLNFQTPFADIYRALTCGKRLPANNIKEIFIQGGIIHLTVVSGAHLLFLEKFWNKIPLPVFIKTQGLFIVLIIYALTSQMHPPIVRALFSFFLFRLSQSFKLFWSAHFITLLSGILCLAYQSSWIYSLSLQLSLLASILQNISKSSIKKCFFIYIFMLPILNRWQSLKPITVLVNWSLSPLISSLLFPLSFLSSFFPFLYKLTDKLWLLLIKALNVVQLLPSQAILTSWFIPQKWIWLYIGFVFLILFVIHTFQRKLYFK